MAHAQKPYFVFRRKGRVNLNRRGCQFSRLLAAEVCASAVVMLDTPCYEVVRRVLATHSTRKFPLHFPSRLSTCAITFQLDSTRCVCRQCRPWAITFQLDSIQGVSGVSVSVGHHISTGLYTRCVCRQCHRVPSHFNWTLQGVSADSVTVGHHNSTRLYKVCLQTVSPCAITFQLDSTRCVCRQCHRVPSHFNWTLPCYTVTVADVWKVKR
jgi:hypothetical protein